MESVASSSLFVTKHKAFFKRLLDTVPSAYEHLDTSRLTLLFFALSGLDVLGCVNEISATRRNEIIEWIYSLQIRKGQGVSSDCCGFRGGFASASTVNGPPHPQDSGHLAMTYTGLSCLLILQDDLSRVDRAGILAGVRACQADDGSFFAHIGGSERDMRFCFCAVAICYLLQDFTAIDQEKLLQFIRLSLNYDGGFGQGPGLESHGGSTYCAIASLHMLDRLSEVCDSRRYEKLVKWCVWKQSDGFHGRPCKPDDSCYTFWIGATLKLLDSIDLIDRAKATHFTCSTQDTVIGGFGKYPDVKPDALHTYISLSGLSLLNHPDLRSVNPALNITQTTFQHWRSLCGLRYS